MDAISDPGIEEVVIMNAAQVEKSELNFMCSTKSRKARSRGEIRAVLMHKGKRTSIDIIITPHYRIKVQEDAKRWSR